MTKDSMDVAIDSKHYTPCSSSPFEKAPFAASDSVSGWDELIHQYQRHVKHRKDLSSRYGLKSKQRSRNSTERDSVCSAVKTTVGSRCADGNPITCPVCSYVVTLRSSLNDVPVETLILKHIQSHEGELDNSLKIPCAVCFNYYYLADIDKHCNQFHGSCEETRICQVVCFTSSVRRYHSLSDLLPLSKGDSTIGERPILRQAVENSKFFEGSSQKSTDHPTTGLPATSDGEESAFNVTTHSVKSYEINWKPLSLNGCLMENSACENGSDVGEFEEYVPHFEGHTVPTGFGQPIMEDKSSIVASTCSLEPTSAIDLTSGISNSGELEYCEESSDSNPSNVELHKLAVRKKFLWSGSPPPPLSKDQTEQLAKLSRSECPFCKAVRGGRGLRVPGSSSDEIKEECMIAHIVKFHHNDPSAAWVLNAKRYRISVDDGLNPLKFLLEPTKDGSLRCSSCERAAFPKISNLRLHWPTCIAVCGRYRDGLRKGRCVLVSPSAAAIKTKKSRSVNEGVRCPLSSCISAWRPSFVYKNAVGQIAHMISRHGSDKQAYELAMEIGKNEHLADEFPFLHVSKSFMNSVERGGVLNLQCAKCDRSFPTPNELVQHAKRYHPTEEHYSGSPRCPILSCKKRLRRWNNITDKVLQLLHVIKEHFLEEEALEWICHWPEKFEFVMEKEFVFKFDVLKSLRFSLEKGAAHILCLPCSELFEYSKYLYHRKRGVCGDANKISEAVPCSLKNRKVKVSYVCLRGSGCSNSRRQFKRSYSLKTASIAEPIFLNDHVVHGFDEDELGSETSMASQLSSLSEVSQKNPRIPSSDGQSQRRSDEVALDSPSTVYYNEISERKPMTVAESDSPTQPIEFSLLQSVRATASKDSLSHIGHSNWSIVRSGQPTQSRKSRSGPSVENNLKDVLCHQLDRNECAKMKTRDEVSKHRTLFDEIPQDILNKIANHANPPEDVSHTERVEGYPCYCCGFKARNVSDMRQHTNLSHTDLLPSMRGKVISPCHHCAKAFETRNQLLRHIIDCQTDISNAFMCGFCGEVFDTACKMREHERWSHELRLFLDPKQLICPHCDRKFENKRNRDEHFKRHGGKSCVGRGFGESIFDDIS